jgi:hypothetical protein
LYGLSPVAPSFAELIPTFSASHIFGGTPWRECQSIARPKLNRTIKHIIRNAEVFTLAAKN